VSKYHTRSGGYDRLKVNVLAYLRTSTDEQKLGIDAQRKAVEKWALENSTTILQTYEDQGVSGTVDPSKRPNLPALLARLEKRDIDYVVVYKRDRLGRETAMLGFLEYYIKKYGARLITVDDSVDDEPTPEQKLLQGVINAMSEYERNLISLRTRHALGAAKDKGTILGRRKRLSYRSNCVYFYAIRWLSERRGCSDEMIQGYLIKEAGMKLSLSTIARYRDEVEVPAYFPLKDVCNVLRTYWKISRFER